MALRYCFLLAALLLLGRPAAAQTPTRPDSLAVSAPAPDTAAALHRLFAAKRQVNKSFLVGALGITVAGGAVIRTARSDFSGISQSATGILIELTGLVAVTMELFRPLDYREKKEQRAMADFRAHKLPRYLKRKLKPKYFR